MNIDNRSLQRVQSLKPLLRAMSDFMDVLIADDAQDIMVFSTPTHPSPFHHNQFGVLIKFAAELGLGVADLMQKVLADEERENLQLKHIRFYVQQLIAEREDRSSVEKIYKQQRLVLTKQYWDMLRREPSSYEAPNEIIYGGNLNDISTSRYNRPKALPERLPPRVPRANLKT